MSAFDPSICVRLGVRPGTLTSDSRRVRPGDVFAAYPGEARDGRDYIAQALAAGAGAVIWEGEGFAWRAEWQVPNMPVHGLREALGEIASHCFGDPSARLWTIGVTGTNGKTSCAHWLAQVLGRLGRKAGVVGTLGNGFPGELAPSANTTPDSVALHGLLHDLLETGAEAVAMEVSSHGLVQGRVNGTAFTTALFTNLSRDHLDYHGDMERYGAAKARLFRWPGLKHAVLNLDDAFGRELAGELGCGGVQVVGYGFGDTGVSGCFRVQGSGLAMSAAGMRFDVDSPWGRAEVASPLLGRFNASNLLGVLAVLLAGGVPLADAARELAQVDAPAGRLQRLGGHGSPLVVVDYAHTPDALEKVLATLREVTEGRLVCVFGCGGGRDKGKRPLMGEAARLADDIIVTSDNPRHEDPQAIIADILPGLGDAPHRVLADRAEAIRTAIWEARPGDVVLLAGKGHEDYQEIGATRHPFSDAETARWALAEREAA